LIVDENSTPYLLPQLRCTESRLAKHKTTRQLFEIGGGEVRDGQRLRGQGQDYEGQGQGQGEGQTALKSRPDCDRVTHVTRKPS